MGREAERQGEPLRESPESGPAHSFDARCRCLWYPPPRIHSPRELLPGFLRGVHPRLHAEQLLCTLRFRPDRQGPVYDAQALRDNRRPRPRSRISYRLHTGVQGSLSEEADLRLAHADHTLPHGLLDSNAFLVPHPRDKRFREHLSPAGGGDQRTASAPILGELPHRHMASDLRSLHDHPHLPRPREDRPVRRGRSEDPRRVKLAGLPERHPPALPPRGRRGFNLRSRLHHLRLRDARALRRGNPDRGARDTTEGELLPLARGGGVRRPPDTRLPCALLPDSPLRRHTAALLVIGLADRTKTLLFAYTTVLLALVYVPILMVVLLSFNSSQNIGLPITGFSTTWYSGAVAFQGVSGFFNDQQAVGALGNSAYVALLTSVVTSLVTITAAMSLRHRYRSRDLYFYAILSSFFIPGILVGLGSSFLYRVLGSPQTLLAAVPVQVVYALPFALILLLPRFDLEMERYENAARVLGANGWQVFLRITFPLIFFQVVGVALFSFVLSWGELSRTNFVSQGQGTLPVYLFARLQSFAPTPEFYSIGTVITGVAAIALVVAGLLLTRGQRRLI